MTIILSADIRFVMLTKEASFINKILRQAQNDSDCHADQGNIFH